MERTKVAVLGGGVCGLYAARKISQAGVAVTLLERAAQPGGLAAGHALGGNFYDFGVHMLHGSDREILDDVRALMNGALIDVKLRALIRHGRRAYRYPLQLLDLLKGVPPATLGRCVVGLAGQSLRNRFNPREPAHAEEALVQLYGRPLYEYFFRDFTHRYWGVPPAALSAAFVRKKMPRLSAVDALKSVLSKLGLHEDRDGAVGSALRDETLYYSEQGAHRMPWALADAIRAAGGVVHLESEVRSVEWADRRVKAVVFGESRRLEFDACLSTLPLPVLLRAMDPPPPAAALQAAQRLRYNPVTVFGLRVRKPRVLDAMYVYYRRRVFHRISEPKNAGLRVDPPGHTLLLIEMTGEPGGAETRRRILEDLREERLVDESDIVEWHTLTTQHGYPVFDLGFESHLKIVQDFLASFQNLASTGRNGAFTYPNMHQAMRMGWDAARRLLA